MCSIVLACLCNNFILYYVRCVFKAMGNSFDGTFCANSERPLTFIFAKCFIIDVWQDFIIYGMVLWNCTVCQNSRVERGSDSSDEMMKY